MPINSTSQDMTHSVRFIALILAALPIVVGAPATAHADVVYFPGGRQLEGVIVRETTDEIELRIAWEGYTTLKRRQLSSIVKTDAADRARLLGEWRSQAQELRDRERDERAFEQAQRERGFVKYRGEWVSREELAAAEQERLDEAHRRETAELRQALQEREELAQRERDEWAARVDEISRRLRALEDENARLRQEVVFNRWALPERVIVAAPSRSRSGAPGLYRDERGNLVRVTDHDGHPSITTTDGRHLDLEQHGDHLSVTDEHGAEQELEPVRRHSGRLGRSVVIGSRSIDTPVAP